MTDTAQPPEPEPEPEQEPRRPTRTRSLVIASVVALAWSVLVAYLVVRLQVAAASECERFNVGDRFGAVFLVWPGLAFGMWAAFTVGLVVLGRRDLRGAVVVGVVITLLVGYVFVAGTAGLIQEMPESTLEACPAGVPTWWPAWLAN